MPPNAALHEVVPSTSFLEYAFLRWVLSPALAPAAIATITAQREVEVAGRAYRVDFEIVGRCYTYAIELDGMEFHGDRRAFTYDRLRQNDLAATGRIVLRFSYDAIRLQTERCVAQLQAVLEADPGLRLFLISHPVIQRPEMDPDPLRALNPSPRITANVPASYFDQIRDKISRKTLRECQIQALTALTNFYANGGTTAACVMSVGAGKTALGVAASLSFTNRRALIVTPGSVIRGTFDRAFDYEVPSNVLYGLPAGPLIPGGRPPVALTLDCDAGPIYTTTRDDLLGADIIVTNFHSLGTGRDPEDLLTKLQPGDVDFIVVDEAHIAAAESYQRAFHHFDGARKLLMSACFQRLDGKPIDADVVYRYLLIDSIADGNAKKPRVVRFSPEGPETTYEIVWPDGAREEIRGRDALLEVIQDERKLAQITAKSTEPIRQVMRAVRSALRQQAELLFPVKPRVLFSALGQRHAEQITRIANEHGIPTDYLHYSMTDARIKQVRERFEQDSGDLQGIVQLKMLGQGYDFPPICVVVPMRPYGSFSEFYQFVGRGIRVIQHAALTGRVGPGEQYLDIIYHAELGLDEHIETIYLENDMEPITVHDLPASPGGTIEIGVGDELRTRGRDVSGTPEAFVLFERGMIEQRVVHDAVRVEQRKEERERELLARQYAEYVQSTENPVTFDQYREIRRLLSEQ